MVQRKKCINLCRHIPMHGWVCAYPLKYNVVGYEGVKPILEFAYLVSRMYSIYLLISFAFWFCNFLPIFLYCTMNVWFFIDCSVGWAITPSWHLNTFGIVVMGSSILMIKSVLNSWVFACVVVFGGCYELLWHCIFRLIIYQETVFF